MTTAENASAVPPAADGLTAVPPTGEQPTAEQPVTASPTATPPRPLALITGVGRTVGIGAGIARQLASSGWDIAFTYWTPYDRRMTWGEERGSTAAIEASLAAHGARTAAIEADLIDPDAPTRIFDEAERRIGPVTALVLSHAESVDSGLLDTTLASFDRHFAVNTRATWLLIREYALLPQVLGSARTGDTPLAPPQGPAGSSRSPATTPSATCRTGPARAPWTASPWPPRANWPTSG